MLRFLVSAFWRPCVAWYLKKPRSWSHAGIRLIVQPGVFHPRFFFSSKFLLAFLQERKAELAGKRFLEPGSGSGLLSIYAAQQGAHVTATDISLTAVENTRDNAARNGVRLTVLHSDLFSKLSEQVFDFILVNPPYYKKAPVTEADHAWYCGPELDYFQRFFAGLGQYTHPGSRVFMILSDDCDTEGIRRIAAQHGFSMTEERSKKIAWEINTIYSITKKQ